ncbi:LON peptidase substrate-binding domain-containing protein [Falsigemmobacter intermedius]|uniref:LON peptidase substrate-binding domain-containing protein n=1 Tax=Falsigemmobacter intermedius TaxID=1553448 RepID=UPI003F0E8D92
MTLQGDLPGIIPLFPLPGALLLPRGRLPLHIFEPRYLAMVEEAIRTPERIIGMIQPREERDDGNGPLVPIGCAGRITQFTETGDGRYLITLAGISRFRLLDEQSGFQPWRRARVDWADFTADRAGAESDPGLDRGRFIPLLRRFFEARQLQTEWAALSEAGDELLINAISMLCPFGPGDKQALLEAPTLSDRREALIALIEYALHAGPEPEENLQ